MKYRVILIICCFPVTLFAQSSIDLFTLAGTYGVPSKYEKPLTGKATEIGTLLNLKVPIVLSDKTTWYNDFTHTLYSIKRNHNEQPEGMLTEMSLQAFIFQTGIVQKINDSNGFQLLLVPRYTTDFNGHNRKNWQLGAIGLYEHRFNPKLLMRFGALYNGELFGPLLVPLIYADWHISERWSINGMFPISLKAGYKFNERLSGGYSHFGFITTYSINQPEFNSDYIERNSIDETLFLRWKMIGNLHLETRIGYSLSRIYQQHSEDDKMDFRLSIFAFGDDRTQKNVNFSSGPIVSLRVVYNLPLDKPVKN